MRASGALICQGILDGSNGTDGYNTAIVSLYRRSASVLTNSDRPTGQLTYTFSTGEVTGQASYFNSWSQSIPAVSAGTKLYVIMAIARSQSETDGIATTDWSTPVEYVSDGTSSAPVFIYKRYPTQPTDKPADGAVYTFATGALTGTLNGWSTNIPATDSNHYPCWVRQAMAVSRGTTDTINAEEWSNPATKLVEDGVSISSADVVFVLSDSGSTAPADTVTWSTTFAGLDISSTNALKYIWQATKVTLSNSTISYTGKQCLGKVSEFASIVEQYALGSVSAATGSWQDNIPPTAEKGKYLWTRTKLTYSGGGTTYAPSEAGRCIGYFGTDGNPGGNTATVFLYRRSTTAVTTVGTLPTLYYKFSSKRLYTDSACTQLFTGQNYWYQDIPSGNAQIYITTAVAYSTTDTDSIGNGEWVTPVQFTENGSQGEHGINTAPIFLYKRSANNISEHGIATTLYYKFADGKLYSNSGATSEASSSDLNGWSRYVPSGSNPCYIIQASALSNTDVDEIATTDWSTPVKYVENGDNAVTYDIELNTAWAKVDTNGYISARLAGTAYKIDGSTRSVLPGATIRFGYILNDSDTYAEEAADRFGNFDAGTWFDGDYQSDYAKGSNNIFAAIVIDGSVKCVKYVTIANQGAKGDTGRMFYLAGEWNNSTRYTRDSKVCPIVHCKVSGVTEEYWYLDAASAQGDNQKPADGSTIWKKAENFGVVLTEALFTNFAKLGSGIVSGDWIISTYGEIDGDDYDEDDTYNGILGYLWFEPNCPHSQTQTTRTINGQTVTGYNFLPVYAVNLKTGECYMNDAYVRGTIYSYSGRIGGFTITSSAIRDNNGNIVLNANGSATFKNVTAEGVIKATLIYSPTANAAQGEWSIVPSFNNPSCYFCMPGWEGSTIVLPDPTTYDGLELSFLTPYGTRQTGGTLLKKNSDHSYYGIHFTPHDAVTINGATYYLPRTEINMSCADKVLLHYNQIVRVRAINGEWYVTDGIVEATT